MNTAGSILAEIAQPLNALGLTDVEAYGKRGRTRRCGLSPGQEVNILQQELGWAVRASGKNSSLFCCGSGQFRKDTWPSPDGYPVRLPAGGSTPAWREPPGFDVPLAVEHEAREILEACRSELERELPDARLIRGVLEDGESQSTIESSLGVRATMGQRLATLRLEAALGEHLVTDYSAARSARAFNPRALARRLVDRLLIRANGVRGHRDRADMILAPRVAVRVLASLLPLLVSRGGSLGAVSWRVGEQVVSTAVDIVDDGALAEGMASSPVDGEGVPTGRVVLLEKGVSKASLDDSARFGCVRRASYRDVPAPGPSHLFVLPDPNASPPRLLEEIARGYYLVEPQGAGYFDLEADRYSLPVGGYSVRAGRATNPISRATISGQLSALLGGIMTVGRDLAFFPRGTMLGSPSLLVRGIELNSPTSL